jgi:hypothetical protein
VNEVEAITTQLGELALTEMDEVERVDYTKEKELNAFTIVMTSGKRYAVDIKAL